jgi:hypothetical protein
MGKGISYFQKMEFLAVGYFSKFPNYFISNSIHTGT